MKPLQANSSVRSGIVRFMAVMVIGLVTALGWNCVSGEIQYRVRAGVHSQCILKSGLVAHDGPVSQVEAIVALKNGLYGGVNNMMSLGGTFYKQLDFLVGNKNTFDSVGIPKILIPTIDATLSYYTLGDWAVVDDDRYIVDFCLTLSKMPVVQPYVSFRYFGSVGEATKDGEFFWLGLSRSQPLGLKPFGGEISLRADASFAFATEGSLGREGGFVYSRIQTSVNVPLSKKFSLCPFWMIQVPSGDQNGRKGDFVGEVEQVVGGFVSAKF